MWDLGSENPTMANTTLLTTFKVGYRYRCTMTAHLGEISSPSAVVPVSVTATWHPKTPSRLSPREMADYRRSRDALIAEISRMIDGNVLVAEPGTGVVRVVRPSMEVPRCPN
jgi:hypothetical protein